MYIHLKPFILSTECFTTCHRLFSNILWIFRGHFQGFFTTFPGMFGDIPRNITFPQFPTFPAFRFPFLYSWFYALPQSLYSQANSKTFNCLLCCCIRTNYAEVFLMMLSFSLLSLPIILVSATSMIRVLICDNNSRCHVGFNVTQDKIWTGV